MQINPFSSRPIIPIGDLVADLIVSIPTLPVEAGQHQLAQDIQLEPGGGANFLIAGGSRLCGQGCGHLRRWRQLQCRLHRGYSVGLAGKRLCQVRQRGRSG